jgi:hypothetical protein
MSTVNETPRTFLEKLAQSPVAYGDLVRQDDPRNDKSTPTTQRTWNAQLDQPDSTSDIASE